MMNVFERFDQIEARFAKLFAGFVLCLVAGLIVFDIVGAALQENPASAPATLAKKPHEYPRCQTRPDGTRICDMQPPRNPEMR